MAEPFKPEGDAFDAGEALDWLRSIREARWRPEEVEAMRTALAFAYRRGAREVLNQLVHDAQGLLDKVGDG